MDQAQELNQPSRNWWALIITGGVAIALAIWVFQHPIASYASLSIIFAVGMLVSGIMQVYFAFSNRETLSGWGWQFGIGIIEIAIGGMLVSNPVVALATLSLYVGFWLLFRGINLVSFAFELKSSGAGNWFVTIVLGILTAIFAIMIIKNPAMGSMTIVTWTYISLFFAGVAQIILGFKSK